MSPLVKVYVTFMVAMGTSLSDRAWTNNSAVYRVSGVVSVIGGWFFTAFSAFSICGLIVFIIHSTGLIGIIITLAIVALMIVRNHINFKKKGEICAGAIVKARILSKQKGPLETSEILETLYVSNDQPNIYPWLTEWKNSRLSLLERNKKNRA